MINSPTLTIICPVFNDWNSFILLLRHIDEVLSDKNLQVNVLAVNDGSFTDFNVEENWQHIGRIQVLSLIRNMGHQRAIAVGLSYCWKQGVSDYIVVMDADGEDKPEDISRLMDASVKTPNHIIFAKRDKRSETFLFKLGYFFYKALYRLLTGISISYGNFCLIPGQLLGPVVHHSEIWLHFSSGINVSKLPISNIPTNRGKRYAGASNMNLVSLILHGLSAISVRADVVAVRLLIFTLGLIGMALSGLLAATGILFMADITIPTWALYCGIGFFTIIIQVSMMALILLLTVSLRRMQATFTPAHRFESFIETVKMIFDGNKNA